MRCWLVVTGDDEDDLCDTIDFLPGAILFALAPFMDESQIPPIVTDVHGGSCYVGVDSVDAAVAIELELIAAGVPYAVMTRQPAGLLVLPGESKMVVTDMASDVFTSAERYSWE
jgi:hypothetical protein